MNLITGTSGSFGKAAVEQYLLKNPGEKLAILSRTSEKVADLTDNGVELRIGNYSDYASLVNAFSGIKNLLLVSSNDLVNRDIHHKNMINAAKEAGVEHVLFTSFQFVSTSIDSSNALMPIYVETENYLKNSGLSYTILRNGIYTDLLPGFIGDLIKENKTLFAPAGNAQIAFTSRNDLAEAAAIILKSNNFKNEILDLTNLETVNFSEIASILSSILKQDILYIDPSADEYQQALVNAGLPAEVIGLLAGITASISAGEFSKTSSTLTEILERDPETVKTFLTNFYA